MDILYYHHDDHHNNNYKLKKFYCSVMHVMWCNISFGCGISSYVYFSHVSIAVLFQKKQIR